MIFLAWVLSAVILIGGTFYIRGLIASQQSIPLDKVRITAEHGSRELLILWSAWVILGLLFQFL